MFFTLKGLGNEKRLNFNSYENNSEILKALGDMFPKGTPKERVDEVLLKSNWGLHVDRIQDTRRYRYRTHMSFQNPKDGVLMIFSYDEKMNVENIGYGNVKAFSETKVERKNISLAQIQKRVIKLYLLLSTSRAKKIYKKNSELYTNTKMITPKKHQWRG
tara:strand:+ start:667 stop:1146 length:480 start_codon:yes stop_codon:yes gene_type:complete